MLDLTIYETGNGGDLALSGNDLLNTSSLFNMPYLAMFGGNAGYPTPTRRPESEQAFDWWGNSLLVPDEKAAQFNSLTEAMLMSVALNSAGRIRLQQTVEKDLEFMSAFAEVSVQVSIVTVDHVRIAVQVREPDNQQALEFVYVWDATKQEVISNVPAGTVAIQTRGIDYNWNDYFYIDYH